MLLALSRSVKSSVHEVHEASASENPGKFSLVWLPRKMILLSGNRRLKRDTRDYRLDRRPTGSNPESPTVHAGGAVIRFSFILNGRANNSGGCRPPQPRIIESKQVKREPGNWLPFVFAQTVRALGFLTGRRRTVWSRRIPATRRTSVACGAGLKPSRLEPRCDTGRKLPRSSSP
jgi:hypothetical protein